MEFLICDSTFLRWEFFNYKTKYTLVIQSYEFSKMQEKALKSTNFA